MRNNFQILVTLAVIIAVASFAQGYWEQYFDRWVISIINFGFTITVILLAVFIFLENRNPSKTIAWLIVLALFPYIGFAFFLVFGQSYRKQRLFRKRVYQDDEIFSRFAGSRSLKQVEMAEISEHQQPLFQLAQRFGSHPISFSTDTRVLTNGEDTYHAILGAIRNATKHIHLEYYTVRDDGIGRIFKHALMKKAREGVEVRFLYDAVGSWMLSRRYRKDLRGAGVKMVPFFPVKLPFFNHKLNFRNHRKIVVVDGEVGFIGGLNIGDEYLGKKKNVGFWRDTHLQVMGEGVRQLQLFFLRHWYYMSGQSLLLPEYLSSGRLEKEHSGGVQMIASGPDGEWEAIKSLFFSMIASAKHSIWIASPYFIPDDDIFTALRIAALSDVDVRLLVPKHPDKRVVFYASRSYFLDLLEAGVKIYEYRDGFMHSKIIVVDEELASIGTANMDMRSFHLNFEVNAFLYHTESTTALVHDFHQDFCDSEQISLENFRQRPILSRVVESTSRLLSPLL